MAEIAERESALAGPLRLSAPVSFGTLHLGPALYPFLLAHPRIELTLELDDRFVDAAADGFDAVLRHGPVHDTRLTPPGTWPPAAGCWWPRPPIWRRTGRPANLTDLGRHRAVLYSNRDSDWRFRGEPDAVVVRPQAAVRVNNGLMMRGAALAGVGITLLPTSWCTRNWRPARWRWWTWGWRRGGPKSTWPIRARGAPGAKVRALADHLRRAFGTPPYWEAAPAPP